MHDAAEGSRTPTTTNWSLHDTPSMWRMLEPQETVAHWRHVTGLRKLAELTSMHLSRLREYRSRLAEAWPPEKSAASRAFLTRLDYLIAHIRDTHEVAVANHATLTAAVAALDTTRAEVSALHAEYTQKLATKRSHDALIESTKSSLLPGTTIGPPPVTEAELERLNGKARTAMAGLSQTLLIAQAQFRRPAPFSSSSTWETPGTYDRKSGPAIPPVVAIDPSQQRSAASSPSRSLPTAQQRRLRSHGPKAQRPQGLSPAQSTEQATHNTNNKTDGKLPGTAGRYTDSRTTAIIQRPGTHNPNGGKIGPPEAIHRTIISTQATKAYSEPIHPIPPNGMIARPQDNTETTKERRAYENGHVWVMPTGVAPVISTPGPCQPPDPGPAIGLRE